ncbi:Eukaryotic translation initiation factor 3 subunit 10 [Zea mays]|nr:Eukaryotic translation initiation factor 3 subunit 10 [Zea mays]AQK97055.1 Eukaryotic translation initiation factor 3 subunit 10 [Zea mays]AQK97056.1 Eukaryotic translation initiation factor 3 subunit 10 [Zea mays]
MSRTEQEAYSYRRDTDVNEISAKEKYNNPDMQAEKHSRRKDDSEDTDKWSTDNRDSDDRKTLSRYEHGKSRSSKEQRFDDDKYKEKYKDDYVRDKRQHDDKFSNERVARSHESDRAEYKSAKDGRRSSESHYRKDAVQDVDHYEDYNNRYKESRGKKRPPEENDDQYDLKPPSTRDQRVHLEKSSGSGRLDSLTERARPDRSSSPSKIHSRSSPSPSSYHDKDQSRHGSKVVDHGKREIPYDERNNRPRASSGRERTPASRLRDRDAENWSSERLKQKDDYQPRDVTLEISTSHYDRTPSKDKHTSPKQLSEKSPSSGDHRFSGRLSGGRSLDNKGERKSLTKYRDRDGDIAQERSHHQDRMPAKVPFREPTPSNSSISRGGHFLGSSPNNPLPPARNGDPSFQGPHDDDRRPQNGDRRFHGHQKRNDMNSVRGHGHGWNSQPNWPSPVSNGFVPIQHGGAPGFHPPVHQFPGPPMFNLRPQMKLNQPGVSYPMHDAVDRFSTHMRPFGWPNHLDESCPPHMQVWNGGSGVFPGEPYIYGRQEWDQNRPHAGSRGWELTGDVSKGPNDVPDAELLVAKKDPDSAITAVSDSGGQHNLQPEADQKEIGRLTAENFEAKNHTKSSKSLEAPQGAQLVTSMLSKNSVVFCKNYLSRISVSHDLVEPELYKRCISLLGDLDVTKTSHLVRNEIQDNGNIGKMSTKYGNLNPFSSRYLKSDNTIFERALALHKNQTQKGLTTASASVKMEEKMAVPEDDHDMELLEPVVSNPAPQRHTDVMEEGSVSKHELGDGIGRTIAATIGSGVLDAPPEISLPQPEVVVATTVITQPNKHMEDVLPPAIEDGALQATLEHAVGIPEVTPADVLLDVAPSAVGESGDDMEIIPSAMAEPQLGKEPAPVASPDSQEKPFMLDSETGMEVEVKVIDDNPGDGRVSSILGTKLDFAAIDGDSEALLVESRVNLSRIPNSPESTH